MCLIIFFVGAGVRPSAVSNMTVGELRAASLEADGVRVVNVADHKKKDSGMQPIPFIIKGRYQACLKFLEVFKPEAKEDDYMFTNSNGNRADASVATNWLKRFLADFLTVKEMKTWTAKCWRHAWSNWSEDSSDPEMAALAAKVMMHSPGVRTKHYVEQNRSDAARFSKAIVGHLVDRDEDELETDVVEVHEIAKIGGRSGTRFNQKERALLKRAFFVGGNPPKGITNASVEIAKRKCPDLVPLYERELKKEGRINWKVNKGIRKAIIPKGKK
jgi:hypothetical protein